LNGYYRHLLGEHYAQAIQEERCTIVDRGFILIAQRGVPQADTAIEGAEEEFAMRPPQCELDAAPAGQAKIDALIAGIGEIPELGVIVTQWHQLLPRAVTADIDELRLHGT